MTGLDILRRHLDGRLVEPGQEGYVHAARAWNLAVDQRPLAAVDAHTRSDITATVLFSRRHRLAVATQPTGHGATGHNDDGTILLRTTRLDHVHVDPAARTARVGAGARWGQVQQAAAPFGLTGLAGSSPVISVAGYLLGGGLSWFSRRHGWACDSLRSLEIIDADGTPQRVSPTEDPELFWALRGGGGGYGVVTELEIDLHPADPLYGGRMLWPIDRAPDVLDAYRHTTAAAPDELTVWIDILRLPDAPAMIAADATYLGEPDHGRALLAHLDAVPGAVLSDTRGPLTTSDIGSITMEPVEPTPFLARVELLTDLTDRVLHALLTVPSEALVSVRVRHLAGALARPTESPPGPLVEPYLLYLLGDPSHAGTTAIEQDRDAVLHACTPAVSGRRPFTYLAPGDTPTAAFPPATLQRLRTIRHKHDPDTVFTPNFDVLS